MHGKAQFSDNFSDGDFTNNPTWTGNTADFIVNAAQQLQSNNTIPNAGFYLSTSNTLASTAEWTFTVNLTFNPSNANYVDVFLTANASDLTAAATTGYFVRIGGTTDEVSLFRKDAGTATTKIIDGVDGILNTSNNLIKIKVTRNASNVFTLLRDAGITGNFFNEGIATDATFTSSSFFGIVVRQSTSTFFQRHFFDDIEIKPFVPDVTPPAITSVVAISNNSADVLFTEAVELLSSQQAANYAVNNGIGFPNSATRDAINLALVHLVFTSTFPNRTALQLTVNGVRDFSGNTLNNGSANFAFFTAAQYDVVIDELMADPTPLVGLPNVEWIELKNTTAFNINLRGWRISDASSQSGPMPAYILKADSFVMVASASAAASLAAFGPVISVSSFPSLDNAGDLLTLYSNTNATVHHVAYKDSWYQNELKKDGGWTLEMIDTKNPCAGISNWRASTNPIGGTPAKVNAVNGNNPDAAAPALVRAAANNPLSITLVFNENLDSTRAALASRYSISDGIGTAVIALPIGPSFSSVQLTLSSPLVMGKIYTVTVTGITDCTGNVIGNINASKLGLFENLQPFDVIVNEILFNPTASGTDYVELYNRSKKIINLKNAYLANRNTAGTVSSITQLSPTDFALFPGEFIVATKDKAIVQKDFITLNNNAFIEVNIPSYSDDKGNVILLNEQGIIIDEISYSDKWHFALIANTEAVALERINYEDTALLPSAQQKNWHSAASSAGFGTPTYKNSQYSTTENVAGEISVTPAIVSPDNDGNDDFATITYSFPEPGYVANITIFDGGGRPVRFLQRNALNGLQGFYRWDGLGEKQQKLPVGIYIIYTEVFNLAGKTKRFKNTIVLARRQ